MLPNKDREVHSSIFLFQDEATLVSYVPKKRKAVILLSSEHYDNKCAGPEFDFKPDIILHYNNTKGGVDAVDWMIDKYTCQRGTRRWPLAMFYNILDMAALNAFIIYQESDHPNVSRLDFIKNLALELASNYINKRKIARLPLQIQKKNNYIKRALKTEETSKKKPKIRDYCGGCHVRAHHTCIKCNAQICSEHSVNFFQCKGKCFNSTIENNKDSD